MSWDYIVSGNSFTGNCGFGVTAFDAVRHSWSLALV
jgi:hypothetical protein